MLEKSFGLFFFLKQPKNQTEGDRYVYLRITVDGTAKEVSLKRNWSPERWNANAGRAAGNKEDARSLNDYLSSLAAKIYQARVDLINQQKAVTAEKLKNTLTGIEGARHLLLQTFNSYNKQIKEQIGNGYRKRTHQRYCTAYIHTEAFILAKYGQKDISIADLDIEFVTDFSIWLRTKKKIGHNTTMKYIMTMKRIVLQCVAKGWIKSDPFIGFKTAEKQVHIEPLDSDDLLAMESKTFAIERIALVRDMFLFSCYTGLAYVDAYNLKKDQIIIGLDGKKWISIRRTKTDSPTRIPLLKTALKIVERYELHPKCIQNNSVLPMISNQRLNSYLKEIADLCGIKKRVTFHIARHTFATTVLLSNGVPLETVSKLLGHKYLKQTQHYTKIVDIKVSNDIMDLEKKIQSKAKKVSKPKSDDDLTALRA
jgi:site-specific recombinase XerD